MAFAQGWSQDVLRNQPYPEQVWGPAGKLPYTTFGNELIDFYDNAKKATGMVDLDAVVPVSSIVGAPDDRSAKLKNVQTTSSLSSIAHLRYL